MFYYRDNFGCLGLIGTILVISVILAIVANPMTWIVVGGIVLYMVISRRIYRKQNPDDDGSYYGDYREDSGQAYTYSSGENVNPYSYRESIPEENPFTEDEFNTNAIDVDVEVEPVDVQ